MILKASANSSAKILKYESGIMRAEVQFYKHMEGRSIPIPRLITYDFSQNDIDCDFFETYRYDKEYGQQVFNYVRDHLKELLHVLNGNS